MDINLVQILILAAIAVVSWLAAKYGVKWGVNFDSGVELRRRGAFDLAAKLRELGLVQIPDFLADYAVGDYSGMVGKMANLGRTFLQGEDTVMAEFAKVFDRLLSKKLETAEGRLYVKAKMDEVEKRLAALAGTPSADEKVST